MVRKTVISVGKCSQGGGASSPVAQGAKWIGFGHWGKQVDTESGGSGVCLACPPDRVGGNASRAEEPAAGRQSAGAACVSHAEDAKPGEKYKWEQRELLRL